MTSTVLISPLSSNDFYSSHISPEFGRFSILTHLDLFSSNFSGQIPSEISHLSKFTLFVSIDLVV
uniref:Putative ovule protein n=1 Tax=Solanum chacoense TaxID=4108 RepID=A0A0V0H5W2_SOLCH